MTPDMARGMLQWLWCWQLAGHRAVAWNGAAIEAGRSLRWVTRRGTAGVEPLRALLPVREVIRLPPPDQTRMDEPIPPDRPVAWALPVLGAMA